MHMKAVLGIVTTVITLVVGFVGVRNWKVDNSVEREVTVSQEEIAENITEPEIEVEENNINETTDELSNIEENKSQEEVEKKIDEKSNSTNSNKTNSNKTPTNENKTVVTKTEDKKQTTYEKPKNEAKDEKKENNVTEDKKEKETKKEYTYKKNEKECQMLVSEFLRITNNNKNFSVTISENAKQGYPFYPYGASEIKKQVCNINFGKFCVYSEDVYCNGEYQRTIYYINFY